MANSMEVPQKIKIGSTMIFSISTSEHSSEENEVTVSKRYLYPSKVSKTQSQLDIPPLSKAGVGMGPGIRWGPFPNHSCFPPRVLIEMSHSYSSGQGQKTMSCFSFHPPTLKLLHGGYEAPKLFALRRSMLIWMIIILKSFLATIKTALGGSIVTVFILQIKKLRFSS